MLITQNNPLFGGHIECYYQLKIAPPSVYTRKMTLPFGESHWDYLPDLVQNYIEDLAASAVHRERMKAVCKSIHLYKEWRYQQNSQKNFYIQSFVH